MFSVERRQYVEARILALARADARVVAGALVGSLARGPGDAFSDIDLTFGVLDDVPLAEVLDPWSEALAGEFGAVRLFDLPSGGVLYRVWLLPDCLQVDLSVAPASLFGAMGPDFKLLFGHAVTKSWPPPPDGAELLGYAVHHLVRARVCIERDKFWQAEYWISAARDYGLSLACLRCGLPARFGRGIDGLPEDILLAFRGGLVQAPERLELLRALGVVVTELFREVDDFEDAKLLAPRLLAMVGQAGDLPSRPGNLPDQPRRPRSSR